MKNKVVCYLLSGLFLFFVSLGITNAKEFSTYIEVPFEGAAQIIDGTVVQNASCKFAENNPSNNVIYFDVKPPVRGTIKASLKDEYKNGSVKSGTNVLICTYDDIRGLQGDIDATTGTGGTITITLSFSIEASNKEIRQTVSKLSPKVDLTSHMTMTGPNYPGSYIKSVEFYSNQKYIDYSQSSCEAYTNGCYLTVGEQTFIDLAGKNESITGKIVYVNSDGQELYLKFELIIISTIKVTADAGAYGTCGFDGTWTEKTNSKGKGTGVYTIEYTGNRIILPSCDASNSADFTAEFQGWAYLSPGTDQLNSQNVMVSNICASNYPKTTGDVTELVKSGVTYFYSCYKAYLTDDMDPEVSSVILMIGDATIAENFNPNAKVTVNGSTYTIVQDRNIDFVFPTVTSLPSRFSGSNTKVTYYWTLATNNYVKYGAGDRIKPSGQTYSLTYRVEETYEDPYDYKIMYAGASQVYALSGITFTSCSSSSSIVSVSSDSSGGCMLTAQDNAEGTATITATDASGKTYTLNLQVRSRQGTTETVAGSKSDFVVKFDNYTIAGYASNTDPKTKKAKEKSEKGEKEQKNETDVGNINSKVEVGDECTNYSATLKFGPDNHTIVSFPVKMDSGEYAGQYNAVLGHSEFSVKCADSDTKDTNTYPAICIDPSAKNPTGSYLQKLSDGEVYSKVRSFLYSAIQDSSYQKALISDTENTNGKIAVTFVARMIGAGNQSIRVVKTDGHTLVAAYLGFWVMYDKYNEYGAELVSKTKAEKNSSGGNLYNWSSGYDTAIENLLKRMPLGSATPAEEPKVSDVQVDTGEDGESSGNSESDESESGSTCGGSADGPHKFTFTGTLELPADAKQTEANVDGLVAGDGVSGKMECAEGLTCELTKISKSDFEFTVEFEDESLLSDMENIKMFVYFKSYSMKSSIIFLGIPGDSKTQRLAIFKAEQVYAFKFGGDIECVPTDEDDEPEECDLSEFDLTTDFSSWDKEKRDKWNELECCDYVTDMSSKAYQSACGDKCSKVTYAAACDPDSTSGDGKYEVYTFREGYDKESGDGDKIGSCIVDVEKAEHNEDDKRQKTDIKTDAVGNELVMQDFSENEYCRVSCKEDWNLKTPGFKNFTGENAIRAGQYFKLNEQILLSGKRTCVTTYIDYEHYKDDMLILSGQMVAAYNTYVEAKTAYESAEADWATYSEYDANGNETDSYSENPHVGEDTMYFDSVTATGNSRDIKDNKGNVLYTEYEYTVTSKQCPLYNVHVKHGDSIDNTYNNKDFTDLSGQQVHGEYYSTKFQKGYSPNDQVGTFYTRSTPVQGSCESIDNDLNTFEDLIEYITYKSKNENASFKGYERYDGKLDGDDWETIEGKLTKDSSEAGIMADAKKKMAELKDELNEKAEYFGACQNFYMKNTAESEFNEYFQDTGESPAEEAFKGKAKAYEVDEFDDKSIERYEIASPYDPLIRYQYEEWEYMTLIDDKNYLIPDEKRNNKELGGGGGEEGQGPSNVCADTKYEDDKGDPIQICVNKIDTYGYKSEDGWENDDENGKTYGGDENKNDGKDNVSDDVQEVEFMICLEDGDEAKCGKGDFYYYEVNYIKQTLSNGGYYKNYGDFYISQYSDIKIFAQTRDDAAGLASAAGSSADDWGPLGGNAFPIGIDTKRNIYQYLFSFGQVGIYNETNTTGQDPTLGRFMGGYLETGTNSSTLAGGETLTSSKDYPTLVEGHIFACFYEVYEELCLCCGLPINTTVVMPSGIDARDDYGSYATGGLSDMNKGSESGTLGFYTSTVSLYDLDGIPNDKDTMPTNWSENDTFTVYGNTYSTKKGGELASAIVSVGNEIYDAKPEYSYTLTPAAMAEIRDYNGLNGYEHNIKNMSNVGPCAIASDSNGCSVSLGDLTEDEVVIFTHYASNFLENLDTKYTTAGNKNLSSRGSSSSAICSVNSGSVSSVIDMQKLSNCRWVDYVMSSSEAAMIRGDSTIPELESVQYFRLAFK